jgi:hypothetical protein
LLSVVVRLWGPGCDLNNKGSKLSPKVEQKLQAMVVSNGQELTMGATPVPGVLEGCSHDLGGNHEHCVLMSFNICSEMMKSPYCLCSDDTVFS